jgi:hypothetical protein
VPRATHFSNQFGVDEPQTRCDRFCRSQTRAAAIADAAQGRMREAARRRRRQPIKIRPGRAMARQKLSAERWGCSRARRRQLVGRPKRDVRCRQRPRGHGASALAQPTELMRPRTLRLDSGLASRVPKPFKRIARRREKQAREKPRQLSRGWSAFLSRVRNREEDQNL